MELRFLSHFLYAEFYRVLTAGNVQRQCHNCGRYFLLTAGYSTCYCNNGETERTCRKVGVHRKANHPTRLSPTLMEYPKSLQPIGGKEKSAVMAGSIMELEQGKLEEMRKSFTTF